MRKKELLEKIPKKLPDHNTARIIRAGGEQVLMVILPEWQKRDPKANGWVDRTGLVHFCWKWGYLTYYITSGTWSQEGFGWIENTSSLQANNFTSVAGILNGTTQAASLPLQALNITSRMLSGGSRENTRTISRAGSIRS